jgi:hypothetical protein
MPSPDPDRPRYRLTIRAEPDGEVPAHIRLRALLKRLLRQGRFRAELVEELPPDSTTPAGSVPTSGDSGREE